MRELTATATDVRTAVESDAPAIVRVIRSRFNAEFGSFYIHACHGAARFVRRQILASPLHGDSQYTVAVEGASVVGCVELKQGMAGTCFNYVAVLPSHESRGLGSSLLRHALAQAEPNPLMLDVVSTKRAVIDWYKRLRFVDVGETTWLSAAIVPVAERRAYYATGLPQAAACLQEYGFGEFRLHTDQGVHAVGLLGHDWFSIPADGLADPAIGNALRAIDGHRRLLLRVNDASKLMPSLRDCRELLRTRRMTAAFNDVRSALHAR